MLEKQKIWCKEKLEKGKVWFNQNKDLINFGAGVAAMACATIVIEYLDAPMAGKIVFVKDLEDDKPNLEARVYYLNRLRKERNCLNIRLQDDNGIKALCDNLNKMVYPDN